MVASYTASAAALAAVPVPFASRALCVPVQVAMVLSIAKVYRVAMSKKTAIHLSLSIAGSGMSVPAYMTLDWLKLVPGFNVPAVAAEAALLGTITTALGWVATQLLREVRSKAVLNEVKPEELAQIMDVNQLQQMFRTRLRDLRTAGASSDQSLSSSA
ncbi:unnamed protein product [Effrenium voratum]|uniref:Uncharacterized protein n=1 Tax=Effrenium voratum TaxID=2562239 RepID=A0AA36HU63_9DINO|nr:unnamed protein product [Effrenium voratum]